MGQVCFVSLLAGANFIHQANPPRKKGLMRPMLTQPDPAGSAGKDDDERDDRDQLFRGLSSSLSWTIRATIFWPGLTATGTVISITG